MSDRERLLDLYLDDQLEAEERAAFEQRLESDDELRELVNIQGRIDGALREHAAGAPDPAAVLTRAAEAGQKGGQILRPPFWRRPLSLVAAAAVLLLLANLAWKATQTPDQVAAAPMTFDALYHKEIADGFKPAWVCETDEEFQGYFKSVVGQPLALGEAEGVEAIGLAYVVTPLSNRTLVLLAKVDGKESIVFVDRLSLDSPEVSKLGADTQLKLHRAVIGQLVLYELSPFDQPRALKVLRQP